MYKKNVILLNVICNCYATKYATSVDLIVAIAVVCAVLIFVLAGESVDKLQYTSESTDFEKYREVAE